MFTKALILKCFPFIQGLKTACLGELKQPEYKTISFVQYCRYVKDFVVYGVTPQEYDFFRFNELSRRGKNEFITFTRSGQLNNKYNSIESYRLLNDKWAFNEYFKKFIKRKYILLNEKSNIEDMKRFIAALNGAPFLSKPLDSSYGRGISVGYTYDDLLSLREMGGKNIIVEEKLSNDEALSILNDSSLNRVC